jgi:hypothetical protein
VHPEAGQGLVESTLIAGTLALAILAFLLLLAPYVRRESPLADAALRTSRTLPSAGAWQRLLVRKERP